MNKSDLLLEGLFQHIDRPSKRWPNVTVGKRQKGKITWFTGGVDDEFRDYLVAVERHLNSLK